MRVRVDRQVIVPEFRAAVALDLPVEIFEKRDAVSEVYSVVRRGLLDLALCPVADRLEYARAVIAEEKEAERKENRRDDSEKGKEKFRPYPEKYLENGHGLGVLVLPSELAVFAVDRTAIIQDERQHDDRRDVEGERDGDRDPCRARKRGEPRGRVGELKRRDDGHEDHDSRGGNAERRREYAVVRPRGTEIFPEEKGDDPEKRERGHEVHGEREDLYGAHTRIETERQGKIERIKHGRESARFRDGSHAERKEKPRDHENRRNDVGDCRFSVVAHRLCPSVIAREGLDFRFGPVDVSLSLLVSRICRDDRLELLARSLVVLFVVQPYGVLIDCLELRAHRVLFRREIVLVRLNLELPEVVADESRRAGGVAAGDSGVDRGEDVGDIGVKVVSGCCLVDFCLERDRLGSPVRLDGDGCAVRGRLVLLCVKQ